EEDDLDLIFFLHPPSNLPPIFQRKFTPVTRKGLYKPVQCHQSTGYCWCVLVDTGRPLPELTTLSVMFPIECYSAAPSL
uniref:Thyroglobulin type-1 domain-containing protein n=1 Tax=Accipiter nisus TaxID=211598 RepID=A0A8B9NBT5_9AVES